MTLIKVLQSVRSKLLAWHRIQRSATENVDLRLAVKVIPLAFSRLWWGTTTDETEKREGKKRAQSQSAITSLACSSGGQKSALHHVARETLAHSSSAIFIFFRIKCNARGFCF